MDRLPLLPGFVFDDHFENKFHVSHTLSFKNGYAIPRQPKLGVGQRPLDVDSLAFKNPERGSWTGLVSSSVPRREFVPRFPEPQYAELAGKTLVFRAYSLDPAPRAEMTRVRHVLLYYHLEDDTMSLLEPPVPNSGFVQGKVMRRHRVPRMAQDAAEDELPVKPGETSYWHWKHLNVGIQVWLYGHLYYLVSCDEFSRRFLQSQGVEVGTDQPAPPDPYTELLKEQREREAAALRRSTSLQDLDHRNDKLGNYLAFDRKVLRFFGAWRDPDDHQKRRRFKILFYLSDDSMEVRPEYEANDGLDHFPKLVGRRAVLKSPQPVTLPSMSIPSPTECYGPQDLKVGETIDVLGKPMLLLDCDDFTRDFYSRYLNSPQPPPVGMSSPERRKPIMTVAPHTTGLGSTEDSLQSCLHLMPRAPRGPPCLPEGPSRPLRYSLRLDSARAADVNRRFVLSWEPRRDQITITELAGKNTGVLSGRLVGPTKLVKPSIRSLSDVQGEESLYYGPQDFTIGAVVEVRGQRFVVIDADLYVLKWLETQRGLLPTHLESNLRAHFERQGLIEVSENNLEDAGKDMAS